MMDSSGVTPFDPTGTVTAGERHILQAEEELRLELNFPPNNKKAAVQIIVQKGSCELYGIELALQKTYLFSAEDATGGGSTGGGMKLAFYTWYGAVIDIIANQEGIIEMSYISDETACNLAYVNTHAQLEVLRDDAVMAANNTNNNAEGTPTTSSGDGPRVLVCGPKESGKSSLVRVLTAYACKLGRHPMVVDLDPADNGLSVPGTLAACPMDNAALSVEMFAQNCMTPNPIIAPATTGPSTSTINSTVATPLVVWHGNIIIQDDLYKAQCNALADKIKQRFDIDEWGKSSGIIINTNFSSIQEEKGYSLLLHTIQAFHINVVLVLGHDRLYSMLRNSTKSMNENNPIKVIKVPRSGGVVSRDNQYLRQCRSRAIKRYFYGCTVEAPSSTPTAQPSTSKAGATSTESNPSNAAALFSIERASQLTPFLIQISFTKLTFYKLSSISLSASLLPVAAAQSTEPVQLQEVTEINEQLQHTIVAVCHPNAVAAYEASGKASDLYGAGVAGFVAVERVLVDTEMIHLLAPCAGTLPSHTLLVGENITWME